MGLAAACAEELKPGPLAPQLALCDIDTTEKTDVAAANGMGCTPRSGDDVFLVSDNCLAGHGDVSRLFVCLERNRGCAFRNEAGVAVDDE